MSAPRAVTPLLSRISHPAILPLPRRAAGNNVPHSMTKTRRIWRPNVGRHNLPVNVVGDAFAARTETDSVQQLRRVKMAARDIKTVDKNGGIEGTLVSWKAETGVGENRMLTWVSSLPLPYCM